MLVLEFQYGSPTDVPFQNTILVLKLITKSCYKLVISTSILTADTP